MKSSIASLTAVLSLAVTAQAAVQRYNFTIGNRWDNRTGHGRTIYTINGQSPGPVLEADEGDELEIFMDNQLGEETTMHYHGVYMHDKPYMDGVPGVTQFSVHPRDTFTYRFPIAQQYGIYFYHGHFGPAFADGQSGPIWIRPAEWRPRPYELISRDPKDIAAMRAAEKTPHHLGVTQWNEEPLGITLVQYRDTGYTPWCAQSLIMNGKGRTFCLSEEDIEEAGGSGRNSYGCMIPSQGAEFVNPQICESKPAELYLVEPEEGQEWVWLNFWASGSHHELRISIDEHTMYVVAADGEFVHPQAVQSLNVNLGDRISVLVRLDQKPGDYAIRMASMRREQIITGMGVLSYPGRDSDLVHSRDFVPSSKSWITLNGTLISPETQRAMDEYALAPYPARPPPLHADETLKFMINMTGPSTWILNAAAHQAFRQQIPPLMWDENSRGPTTNGNYSLNMLRNGSVVDIIFINGAEVNTMHPFHKHNHKAWIIGAGAGGGFPWKDVDDALAHGGSTYFNLVNPPMRDGYKLEGGTGAWTAIRYEITFPAASMLHCHMIHHFATGQQVVLLEGPEALPMVPEEMRSRVHADFVPPVRYGPLE